MSRTTNANAARWQKHTAGRPPVRQLDGHVAVPILNHKGEVRAWTLLSNEDAALGEMLWSVQSGRGYAFRAVVIGGVRRNVLLHRVVAGLEAGDRREVDHINRDRLDNRRENLRVLAPGENSQNLRPRRGTSTYRGVCFDRGHGRWLAYGQVAGRRTYLGRFDSEHEAGEAARVWRQKNSPAAVD